MQDGVVVAGVERKQQKKKRIGEKKRNMNVSFIAGRVRRFGHNWVDGTYAP